MGMTALEGRRVLAITIEPSKERVLVTTDDGVYRFDTEGDCCSQSWIESWEDQDHLVGQIVRAVESVEMPEPTLEYDEYDVIRCYGIKFTTDMGTSFLEFRNRSNGYYGGSIEYRGKA